MVIFFVSVKAATTDMISKRAKRCGDGTFGESEEPYPTAEKRHAE